MTSTQPPTTSGEAPATLTFERASSRVSRLRELARPLPPILAAMLDEDAVDHHAQLADRYGKAQAAVLAAAKAVQAAEQADRAAAADAARQLKALPRETVPAAQKKADEAQRELTATTEALAASADGLLVLAQPHLNAAAGEARTNRDQALDQVMGLLQAALDGLAHAAGVDRERGWIAQAATVERRGRVMPYQPGGQPSQATSYIRQAVEYLAGEDARRQESREWHERHREAEAKLPQPPRSAPSREGAA